MVDNFTAFSNQLVAMLRETDDLSSGQIARIRFAIQNRHDQAKVRLLLHDTGLAESVGNRLIAHLAAAEGELEPDAVGTLEKQVLASLPAGP